MQWLPVRRHFCQDSWGLRLTSGGPLAILLMSTSPILVYGRDQRLLQTRSWVLEHAGYRVLQAADLREAEAQAKAEPLGVAVICHTLSAEECRAALRMLRRLRPEVQRLVMTASATTVSDGQQEAVLSAYDGPLGLLKTVGRLAGGQDARQ